MIFGRYQLLELLGTGGMAEVFKAKSYGVEGFEKLLVIKRILSLYSDNEEFVEMFVNEAKIAVSLNHANIVQIYDLGKAGDSYYMAMEYVQGMDLAEIINWSNTVHKPFPLEAAIHIICEVAKGLDYAHRKKDQNLNPLNIIHRDISPQNILVSTEGEVKITDFGIAKALNIVDAIENAPVKGKFAYMAPEQAIAAPHDKRVDIFSAGVVFYELLTGSNPLRNHTPAEILKIIQDPSFPFCQVPCCGTMETIPVDLEPILRKALASNPDERYESAAELYEALLTFAYMVGLRAGASSLAEYIQPLVEEQDLRPAGAHLPSVSPRASKIGSIHESDSRNTSVKRPSDADLAKFDDKNAIHLTASVREAALLAYSWESKSFDSRKLIKTVESFGGIALEKEDTEIVYGFGVTVASDALHAAANCAVEVAETIQKDHTYRAAGDIGTSVQLASLVVESNGNVKLTSDYQNTVNSCRDLARQRLNNILFGSALYPLLNRRFTCAPFNLEDYPDLYQLQKQRTDKPAQTRLIGRRQELKQLGEVLDSVSEGKGHILALSGAPGVGKTRLLQEVKRRLSSAGHNFAWYETNCSPWRKNKALSMLQSLLRNILDDTNGITGETIQNGTRQPDVFELPPHEVTAVEKFVTSGQCENVHVLKSAFIRIIRRSAKKSLVIVALDHLTAVDNESLDIIHALSHSIADISVLLLVGIRLGYIHGFEGSPIFTQCDVEPLTMSETEQLIHSCVPAPSERLIRDIQSVSANLPLFVEETILKLRNDGALKITETESIYLPIELHCPMSIRNIVASELFALPRDRREIVQLAGCLREKIEAEMLGLLLNRPVEDLIPILQMLSKVRLLSAIDETTYRFPSPFVQEAVYLSVEKSERLLIHRTVAQRIEQEYPKELEKYAEPLAVHYLKSNSKKAAFEYLIIAARNAAVTLDHETSVKYYLLALDLSMDGIGNISRYDIFEQLSVMAPQTSQANAVLKKAIRLKADLEEEDAADEIDLSYTLMLDAQAAFLWAHVGEYETAIQQLRSVIRQQDISEAQLSLRFLAMVLMDIGAISEATEILREISTGSPDELDPFANAYLAICLALGGATDEALRRIEGHSPNTSIAPISILYLTAEGHCHFMKNKFDLAIEAYRTALRFAQEQNMKREIAELRYQIATCCLEQLDFKSAFEHLRVSMEISVELQFQCLKDRTQIGLWFIDAAKFNNQDAMTQLLSIEPHGLDMGTQILTNYCLARVYIGQRKLSEAREALLNAKEFIISHGNEFYLSLVESLVRDI